MKFLPCLVTLFITALSQTMALAQERRQNEIIIAPSYLQGHVSERKLTFTVPKDWQVDEEAAAKLGQYAVVLPKGVKRTFYFCLFESVESKWKEAWKIGEQIIQTLILNDDI